MSIKELKLRYSKWIQEQGLPNVSVGTLLLEFEHLLSFAQFEWVTEYCTALAKAEGREVYAFI